MTNMIRVAQKIRLYPTTEQQQQLAKAMGCTRWVWNHALNICNQTYKETGKGISRSGLNALFKKHEKNLARKQQKLSRKQKGSKTRVKAKKLVAKVHARITNARHDYLHKLSRKMVNESKVIVVENLNVKGMMRNHKLAKHISDCGWGTLLNYLDYKLEREDKRLVEINRFFPSSHICPDCLTQTPKMDLSVRKWTCLNKSCNSVHDRDEAASRNIRAEGIRILKAEGTPVSASEGSVRQDRGRKYQGNAAPSFADPASPKGARECCELKLETLTLSEGVSFRASVS